MKRKAILAEMRKRVSIDVKLFTSDIKTRIHIKSVNNN